MFINKYVNSFNILIPPPPASKFETICVYVVVDYRKDLNLSKFQFKVHFINHLTQPSLNDIRKMSLTNTQWIRTTNFEICMISLYKTVFDVMSCEFRSR